MNDAVDLRLWSSMNVRSIRLPRKDVLVHVHQTNFSAYGWHVVWSCA